MLMRWWHESDESCEEAMRLEVDVRSACACGALEGEADAAIRELTDRIVGKRRSQQVPAHSFEPFAITAVDDGGGVQRHAEGGDLERPRWRGRDSDALRSRERELHTPGQRVVGVVVVVHAAESAMDSAQNLCEVVLGRGRRGEPARSNGDAIVGLGERTVGRERVKMNEKSEVIPKTLHDHDDPGMQRSRSGERVMSSGPASHRVHDCTREAPSHAGQQRTVITQPTARLPVNESTHCRYPQGGRRRSTG